MAQVDLKHGRASDDIESYMLDLGQRARRAARSVAVAEAGIKNQSLLNIAAAMKIPAVC